MPTAHCHVLILIYFKGCRVSVCVCSTVKQPPAHAPKPRSPEAPSPEAQPRTLCADRSSCAVGAQKKFLDLSGSAENQGDLKEPAATRILLIPSWLKKILTDPPVLCSQSVVLHKLSMSSQHSSFPIALGIRITGVDDACFSQTGGLNGYRTFL